MINHEPRFTWRAQGALLAHTEAALPTHSVGAFASIEQTKRDAHDRGPRSAEIAILDAARNVVDVLYAPREPRR